MKMILLPILGAIAGDIIGSPYELEGTRIKTKEFPIFNKSSKYTDDTVMTLAVAKWLLGTKGSLLDIMLEIGRKYIDVGFGHNFKLWLKSNSHEPYHSYGNGSAMRVSAIGVVAETLTEVLNLASETASISHNHPEGIKGAQAVAVSVFLAYNGFSKNNIHAYIEEHFNYDLSRSVANIREHYNFNASCQGSVPESIISFLESVNTEDAIRNAISLGGDADTQASIAGAIAAAYYKEIPVNIVQEIKQRLPNELKDIIDEFSKIDPLDKVVVKLTLISDNKINAEIFYDAPFSGYENVWVPSGTEFMAQLNPSSDEIECSILNNKNEIFTRLTQDLDEIEVESFRGLKFVLSKSELDKFRVNELKDEDIFNLFSV